MTLGLILKPFFYFLTQAVKETARRYGTSSASVRKILKEKQYYNTVIDPPNTRVTYTAYEKLTLTQKDQIRKKVISKLSIIIYCFGNTEQSINIYDGGNCCKY